MRKVKMAVSVLFVFSCIVFAVYLVKDIFWADHTPPEISLKEKRVEISVTADDAELLKGVTAVDDKDGDITDSVRIASKSHFIEKGRRTVTYAVFDKANHAASAEQTVVYTDYVSPRIYLDKPLRYTEGEAKSADLLANMRAEDCLLGDVSRQIRVSLEEGWYEQKIGEYNVTLQVGNDAGDICVIPMKAVIRDGNSLIESKKYYPALSEYIVYTSVNRPLEFRNYLTGMMRGNTEYLFGSGEITVTADNVLISDNVNYSVPGVYEVEYSYTSLEGITAVTTLYVVVEE